MEPHFIALLLASTVVGCLIGAVGIGGVLLIPALIALADLTPHQASATALFTFLFTGVLGSILFQRQGSIDWRQTLTVCAGAIVFSYLGAMASSTVDGVLLMRIIAALIVFAGVYVFVPRPAGAESASKPFRPCLLLFIGAAAGFGSGFSGAGGPLFSVPLMVLWGFAPLSAIGTSQVLQIFPPPPAPSPICTMARSNGQWRAGSRCLNSQAWWLAHASPMWSAPVCSSALPAQCACWWEFTCWCGHEFSNNRSGSGFSGCCRANADAARRR